MIALCMILTIILSMVAGFAGATLAMRNDLQYVYPALDNMAEAETAFEFEYLHTSATGLNMIVDDSSTQSIASLVETIVDTVVEIDTQSVVTHRAGQRIQPGAGSGIIISEDGLIVTNNHVIANADGSIADKITVRLRSGESYEATVVGRDAETDLAVLRIDADGLTPAYFGDSSQLSVGELAIAIGNPLGNLGGTVTEGIISALNRDIVIDGETMHVLQTSAAINQGNSGGGLFNAYGELIGVVNAKPIGMGIEGIGFAIPSNVALSITNQLIEHGFVTGRVDFGIELIDINDPITAMFSGLRTMGLYVAQNDDASGLQAGDRIISIAGTNVNNRAEARAVYLNYNVGDALEVTIARNGQFYRTQVILQQMI